MIYTDEQKKGIIYIFAVDNNIEETPTLQNKPVELFE